VKVRTTTELIEWQPPPVAEIVSQGLLHPGSRAVLFGRWGSWKSMLSMHMGFCITAGENWLGFDTAPNSVMIAQVEIPEAMMRERVIKYTNAAGIMDRRPIWWLSEPFLRLDREAIFKEFTAEVILRKPAVLILDPFYRLYTGDINDNFQITKLLDKLDRLVLEMGTAIVMIGHTKKLQPLEPGVHRDWGQELIGGSYIMDWVDTGIAVEPDHERDTDVRLHFVKVRHATQEIRSIKVRVNRNTLHAARLL
jgi:RecA-family ATPase